jgi:uncharacterized protein (DUF1501 family)
MRRRDFLGAAAVGGLVLPLGPRAWALSGSSRSRFLFVFVTGGWDQLVSLVPAQGSSVVERQGDEVLAEAALAGDVPFVDHPERPDVRAFFETHAARLALVHGIEARSVAHDVCLRLMLTGTSGDGFADWGTLLASSEDVPLPMVVLSGPSYSGDLAWASLRVGRNQQLAGLVTGESLAELQPSSSVPPSEVEELEDAFVLARAEAARAEAPDASGRSFAEGNIAATNGVLSSRGLSLLDGALDAGLPGSAAAAFQLFEEDLAACATVEFLGETGLGADSHVNNDLQQSALHNELFRELSLVLEDLDGRTDLEGAPLSESTTVVVMSEMARHPRYNSRLGRDHWTFNSVLLIGSGSLRGGQSIGAYDDGFRGERVVLATGGLDSSGTSLLPAHLGSTLLAIAGRDGEAELGVPPIEALLW